MAPTRMVTGCIASAHEVIQCSGHRSDLFGCSSNTVVEIHSVVDEQGPCRALPCASTTRAPVSH